MSLLASLPIIGKLFDTVGSVVKEVVTDKDAQDKILGEIDTLKTNVEQTLHLAELNVKTIPWVDGLHKMGRQILNLITIIATVVLLLMDIDIGGPEALCIGGGNAAYQVIKGRGK